MCVENEHELFLAVKAKLYSFLRGR
jgi:hypothetical protein